MKKQLNILWLVIIIIAASALTSCTDYKVGSAIEEETSINQQWYWQTAVPSNLHCRVANAFEDIGPNQKYTTRQLLYLRNLLLPYMDINTIKSLPYLYSAYYNTEYREENKRLIVVDVLTGSSGPTWLQEKRHIYYLTVANPALMMTARVVIREAPTKWLWLRLILITAAVLLSAFIVCRLALMGNYPSGTIMFLLEVAIIGISSLYQPQVFSFLLAVVAAVAFLGTVIHNVFFPVKNITNKT